jgi:hypothetical protein
VKAAVATAVAVVAASEAAIAPNVVTVRTGRAVVRAVTTAGKAVVRAAPRAPSVRTASARRAPTVMARARAGKVAPPNTPRRPRMATTPRHVPSAPLGEIAKASVAKAAANAVSVVKVVVNAVKVAARDVGKVVVSAAPAQRTVRLR